MPKLRWKTNKQKKKIEESEFVTRTASLVSGKDEWREYKNKSCFCLNYLGLATWNLAVLS